MDVSQKESTSIGSLSISTENLPVLEDKILVGEVIPPGDFSSDEQRVIAQIAASVNIRDSNSIISFAIEPQRKLNNYLDPLLDGIKGRDIGAAGEMISELARGIKSLDLAAARREAEQGPSTLVGLMPTFIQNKISAIQKFRARGTEVKSFLERIENDAGRHMISLRDGTDKMDRLVQACIENVAELKMWLAAGQQALLRMRAEFQEARQGAIASRDPVRLAAVRDMAEQINAFETRLVNLNIAYTQSTLAIPQVRTQQQAGRIEFQNMMDALLTAIPNIKRAVIQIAGLNEIRKAHAGAEAMRQLNRELGQVGVEALGSAYMLAKDTQGNMAADIVALANVAQKTLDIIDQGTAKDRENKVAREKAMEQIGEVRAKLIAGLTANAENAVRG